MPKINPPKNNNDKKGKTKKGEKTINYLAADNVVFGKDCISDKSNQLKYSRFINTHNIFFWNKTELPLENKNKFKILTAIKKGFFVSWISSFSSRPTSLPEF